MFLPHASQRSRQRSSALDAHERIISSHESLSPTPSSYQSLVINRVDDKHDKTAGLIINPSHCCNCFHVCFVPATEYYTKSKKRKDAHIHHP
mmetsp:Transcript_28925/g.41446  ORF Transcript_28925/g.41446 Transcript_28925/m.41446 type:complete len:92 (+) Transcript_28925:372-647(+)